MLIDDVKIRISTGKGGKGAVAFNKNLMSLGPSGASGGKGGSIYAQGISDLNALNQFRNTKELRAEDGRDGRNQFRDGQDGKDLTIGFNPQYLLDVLKQLPDQEVAIELTAADKPGIIRTADQYTYVVLPMQIA